MSFQVHLSDSAGCLITDLIIESPVAGTDKVLGKHVEQLTSCFIMRQDQYNQREIKNSLLQAQRGSYEYCPFYKYL